MTFAKKVVVAVGMDNDVAKQLMPMREMNFLGHCEIHFVHVFNTVNYTTLLGEFPMIYPLEADMGPIQESVMAMLANISKGAVPAGFDGKIIHRCFFDEGPKSKFCSYVNENHVDLVIIPTREKHGFFDSSFAEYVNKHCTANMIFLKRH